MKRFGLGVFALFAGIIATGCGPIKYSGEITPVAGRNIFVGPARIKNCHELLEKEKVEASITSQSQDYLRRYGYTIAPDAESADLVLTADVEEFNLGSRAARALIGAGQSYHDTTILIHPNGGLDNGGYRRAEVSAGAYSNFKGAEAHQQALINEIAKMHVWVAQKYCK